MHVCLTKTYISILQVVDMIQAREWGVPTSLPCMHVTIYMYAT